MNTYRALLPAVFHTLSFAIALHLHTTSSVLAGTWLVFHLMGCAYLLYNNTYTNKRTALRTLIIAWLVGIGLAAFVIRPVINGATYMWVVSAMPALAICLTKDALPYYIKGFAFVITLFAIGLVLQMATGVNFSPVPYAGRYAWPLLDPNNAAVIVNVGLLTSLWLAAQGELRYSLLALLFSTALIATGSKAGFIVALFIIFVMWSYLYGARACLYMLVYTIAAVTLLFFHRPEVIVTCAHAFADRLPIWWAASAILAENMLRGTGFGTFGYYVVAQGSTIYIPPAFAHNDVLQFAVEMGLPMATLFVVLIGAIAVHTRSSNVISGLLMLAIVLQSMVEFQFYLPSIGLLFGLILAYHRLHGPRGLLD